MSLWQQQQIGVDQTLESQCTCKSMKNLGLRVTKALSVINLKVNHTKSFNLFNRFVVNHCSKVLINFSSVRTTLEMGTIEAKKKRKGIKSTPNKVIKPKKTSIVHLIHL